MPLPQVQQWPVRTPAILQGGATRTDPAPKHKAGTTCPICNKRVRWAPPAWSFTKRVETCDCPWDRPFSGPTGWETIEPALHSTVCALVAGGPFAGS
jgi:hypothetical protein